MDTEAARRARAKQIRRDLLEAFDDDEASPPEWVDIILDVDDRSDALKRRVETEVGRFTADPDIRSALVRRDRAEAEIRAEAAAINEKVRRLNYIAPHDRFHRGLLDAVGLVRPLYRARRRV